MHLFVEIKNCCRLTLTSIQDDATGKVARHGVQPSTGKDSDSTVSDTSSLGTLDGFDEKLFLHEQSKPPKPSRCRSFRRFWPISVHASRKRCVDPTCPFPQDYSGIRKTSRYCSGEIPRLFELSCPSVQELYSLPAEICDQNELFELPVSASEQGSIQAPRTKRAEQQSVSAQSEAPNQMYPTRTMQRFYSPALAPLNPSNGPIGPPSRSPPQMSFEVQSQASSPISPCTPNGGMNDQIACGPGSGIYNSMVPPNGMMSPDPGLYATPWQPPQNTNGYYPAAGTPVPTYMTTTKVPATPLVNREHIFYQAAHTHCPSGFSPTHTPFQGQGYGPGPSNYSTLIPGAFRHGAEDPPMGAQEIDQNPKWFNLHNQAGYSSDAHYSQPSQPSPVLSEPTQDDYRVVDDRQGLLPNYPSNTNYPREPLSAGLRAICRHCRAVFKGKYCRGNLGRHIRGKHNTGPPLPDTTCRRCNKRFNRSDAKKKHEWQVHELEGSQPSTSKKRKS